MSGGNPLLRPTENDITKMLMANVHIGISNANKTMDGFIHAARNDGTNIIDLNKTWEKMLVAARLMVAIENPADIIAISSRPIGQRSILKVSAQLGVSTLAGRFIAGSFTNKIMSTFLEPRVIVVTDPIADHQAVREASYANIPTIAFCDLDVNPQYIDVVIPCNTKSKQSVGLMWWFLCREVLRMKGRVPRDAEWNVAPDLFFYRDASDLLKEEEDKRAAAAEAKAKLQEETAEAAAHEDEWIAADASNLDWAATA